MSTYEISKSSLLSLKAEILRKQEEVNKEKLLNKAKAAQGIKRGSPLDLKNKGVTERLRNDEREDDDLLKKSKSCLEAKAILYEKLSKEGSNIEENAKFLVQFHKKANNLPPDDSEEDYDRYPEDENECHFSDEYEPATNPDEEWVEYVDCLGRTRKCMRKDLAYLKERDSDLKSKIGTSNNDESDNKNNDKPSIQNEITDFNETCELLSSDMRIELLRRKWEKEEEELRKKTDIHYQDILFDEARVHGVGYYRFSKDEKERARQQEALKKLREETEKEQRKAEQLRKMRDKQLEIRTRAARNRKRARMGLPPEEENEQETDSAAEKTSIESTEKEKTAEELAAEKEKELMRQKHVRPWDYGKEGVKEHIEYTQEDWVHKKRKERNEEFAPPSSYNNDKNSLYFTSRKDPKTKEGETKKAFVVDTSKPPPKIKNPSKQKLNPYKSEKFDIYDAKKCKPTPIINECVDSDEEEDELLKEYLVHKNQNEENDGTERKGVEIAPPPTYEYYGPSKCKRSKSEFKKIPTEESISAGLQYLREQAEKKKNSTRHLDDMFLM